MRATEGLPMVYLFSSHLREIDYFGWGDILYFLASISSVIQAFFPFLPISDDFSCIYYIICKFLLASLLLVLFFSRFFVLANGFFLIDSIIYLVAYLIYLFDLRSSLYTGKIPANRTITLKYCLSIFVCFVSFDFLFLVSFL
jgi:hypothetical protein